MYIHSIKETLPYIFCFNRYNYQQSALEFLADISLLGEYYRDLLQSGIMFESLANQPGKQVSCGYILEIFNKVIKQISPNIDSTGNAWLRNLPRLAFIRQILLNASKAKLFSESEKDPITAKLLNLEQISKLRWVLERTNILDVDTNCITYRKATHIISGLKIENNFVNCKLNGEIAMDNLVSKFVMGKPVGSIESLRKELNLKKIVPILVKKRVFSETKGASF